MSDLISRQEAIDYINRAIPNWSEDKETALDCLKNMPSVQERKKGRWIDKDGGLATCSECGDRWGVWSVMNFCPNCGASMTEGAEE